MPIPPETKDFRNPVTGLPDIEMFGLRVEAALQSAAVQGHSVLVMAIAIRGLDKLDKNHCHDLLEAVSHVVKRSLRHTDGLGHAADHCYFALIKDIREHRIDFVCDEIEARLKPLIAAATKDMDDLGRLTWSVGFARFPHDEKTPLDLQIFAITKARDALLHRDSIPAL